MKANFTPDLRAVESPLSPADLECLAFQAEERRRYEAALAHEREERRRVLRANYWKSRRSLDASMDSRNHFNDNN